MEIKIKLEENTCFTVSKSSVTDTKLFSQIFPEDSSSVPKGIAYKEVLRRITKTDCR